MTAPRTSTATEELAALAREAVERGRDDSRLLDGRNYDEARWTAALDAVAELEARATGRRKKPGVPPCSRSQADESLAASPMTLGELEVCETLAGEGVVARPAEYMRLVQVIRAQHDALTEADEETIVGIA